jgi:integrase
MPTSMLTDRACDRAKPKAGRFDLFDDKVIGLSLRVLPTGVKSFTLLYGPAAKRVRVTLGRYPQLSLARARTLALEKLGGIERGEDPRHGKAMSLADLAELYLAEYVKPTLRSAKAVERRLRKNVIPVIGGVALADLHKRDLNRVVAKIMARGKQVEAARVYEDARAMVKWGHAQGHLDTNPVDGMRKPAARPPRTRVLSDSEIAKLWTGLDKALPKSTTVANVIRLCLLTGQRAGEVCGIEPGEIDAKKRIWTIPGQRSKNGEAHAVPLTDQAFKIAKEIANNRKITGHAVAHCIRLAQGRFGLDHWTCHDLRRSVATNLGRLGVHPIVIAHVLNHISVTKQGVTLGVYNQYSYDAEVRAALNLWCDRLAAIVGGSAAQIIPMRQHDASCV